MGHSSRGSARCREGRRTSLDRGLNQRGPRGLPRAVLSHRKRAAHPGGSYYLPVLGPWCNGSTDGFGPSSQGSNPCGPAMSLTAVILAAGRSTRMKSRRPKPLHEICGRPMLEYILRACYEAGCGKVIVVVGYGKEEVM